MTEDRTARSAKHAGSWYTDDPDALGSEIVQWLESTATTTRQPVKAVIVPHAGLHYSGPTAAHSYKHLAKLLQDQPKIKRIFVLGPSHHVFMNHCGLTGFSELATPLGPLRVDTQLNHQLLSQSRSNQVFEIVEPATDENEHSIEMQLPFLAQILRDVGRLDQVKIMPIIVGSINTKQEKKYGEVLAPFVNDPTNLFCISSDFCHWGARFKYTHFNPQYRRIHESIQALDFEGADHILKFDFNGWKEYLKRTENTICGRHPISVFLSAVEASGRQHFAKMASYTQSSKVVSRQESSVSYLSALFSEWEMD